MTVDVVQVEPLWTVDDVSSFLGVPVATLYEWRRHRRGPQALRIGKYLRYQPHRVREWLDQLAETQQ